ncbi:hypothetical protein HYR99_28065 [Candidatus Poribacteria bacterium]|nr:hypothetical protein [Candidatus Poribacteria bacterium]
MHTIQSLGIVNLLPNGQPDFSGSLWIAKSREQKNLPLRFGFDTPNRAVR